jgi:hypothetical protein
MHGDGRVNVAHRAIEAERPGASDEHLLPVGEGNGARDLLYGRARDSSDEHRLLAHQDAKGGATAIHAAGGVPMSDVSYQEDASRMNRERWFIKGIDHDCNFQCQLSLNCAKITPFEMALT